jgi:hypothetical protein
MELRGQNFSGKNLKGVNFIGANLEGANFRGANLEGANLEGANLEGANFRGANLSFAHLEGAHLERADFIGADFTGVDLEGIILSDKQRKQIVTFNLSRKKRNNSSASASPSISNFSRNKYGRNITVIHVHPDLLKPNTSFMPLYEKVMAIDLPGNIRFNLVGNNKVMAIDSGALIRIIYERILPVYIKLFFKKSGDFMLLKEDVDMELLIQQTNQLKKLAKTAKIQIELGINPELLDFLFLQNPKDSIATRQNFNSLYANFKNKVNQIKRVDPYFKVSNYLINNKLKNDVEGNLDAVSRAFKEEILFRKTLYEFGFTSFDQYYNMALFIKILFD